MMRILFTAPSLRIIASGLLFSTLNFVPAHAQPAKPSVMLPSAGKVAAAQTPSGLQSWLSLTPAQRQALEPLSSSWPQLTEDQRKKWLAMSANFNALTPAAKARLHERMAQWAALTPKQRTLARLNYNQTQRVSPQDKAERWEVYQTFTPEQKQALAASAPKVPLAPSVKVPKKPSH